WQRHREYFFATLNFPFHRSFVAVDVHPFGGGYRRDAEKFANVSRYLGAIVVDRLTAGQDEIKRMVFGIIGYLVRREPRIAGFCVDADGFMGTDGQGLTDGGFSSGFANVDDSDLTGIAVGQVDCL